MLYFSKKKAAFSVVVLFSHTLVIVRVVLSFSFFFKCFSVENVLFMDSTRKTINAKNILRLFFISIEKRNDATSFKSATTDVLLLFDSSYNKTARHKRYTSRIRLHLIMCNRINDKDR